MNFGLVIELMVSGLLLVTIGYCFLLDRRLAALRNGQDGLREVITDLNAATQQAQASVMALKATGEQTSDRLKKEIADARALADELSVMVEAGDGIADRLAGARGDQAGSTPDKDDDAESGLAELRQAVDRISEASRAAAPDDEGAEDIASMLGRVR